MSEGSGRQYLGRANVRSHCLLRRGSRVQCIGLLFRRLMEGWLIAQALLPTAVLAQPTARDGDDALARAYLEALYSRDIEFGVSLFDPTVVAAGPLELRALLNELADSLRAFGPLVSAKLAHKARIAAPDWPIVQLTYIIGTNAESRAIRVDVASINGQQHIYGIHWVALAKSRQFSWHEGRAAGYLALALGVGLSVYSVAVSLLMLRSQVSWSVPLGLIALVGVGSVRVAWDGAGTAGQPFTVQLLCTSLRPGSGGSPWQVGISFPVGAVLASSRRRRLLAGK